MQASRFSAFVALAIVAACSGPTEPPTDLAAGIAVVGYLASSRYVEQSMYSATAETGKPSEFVSFLFSSMGAAERPDVAKTQSPGGSRGGPPTWPEGVDFYAHRPNSRSSKQVIVIPDDARGIVVAEAYASGSSKPLIRKEFTLAKPRKPR